MLTNLESFTPCVDNGETVISVPPTGGKDCSSSCQLGWTHECSPSAGSKRSRCQCPG